MVVKRGWNDRHVVDMAAHFRGSGHIVRFIEFMDVGSPTAGAWTTRDPLGRGGAAHRRALPARAAQATYPGEVAEALALPRRRRRDRAVISSVDAAFCSTCTRGAPCPPTGTSTRASSRQRSGLRPQDPAARRRGRRAHGAGRGRDLAGPRPTATSEVRTAETARSGKVEIVVHPAADASVAYRAGPHPQRPPRHLHGSRALDEPGNVVPTPIAGRHPLTLYMGTSARSSPS